LLIVTKSLNEVVLVRMKSWSLILVSVIWFENDGVILKFHFNIPKVVLPVTISMRYLHVTSFPIIFSRLEGQSNAKMISNLTFLRKIWFFFFFFFWSPNYTFSQTRQCLCVVLLKWKTWLMKQFMREFEILWCWSQALKPDLNIQFFQARLHKICTIYYSLCQNVHTYMQFNEYHTEKQNSVQCRASHWKSKFKSYENIRWMKRVYVVSELTT
jgi:hypothetical protein